MKHSFSQRILEIIPGSLMWATFILPFAFAHRAPFTISILILIYAVFWLFRTIVMSGYLIRGYLHYKHDIKLNWLSKCHHETNQDDLNKLIHLVLVATYKEELETLRSTFLAITSSTFPLKQMIIVLAVEERDQQNGLNNAEALNKEFGHFFDRFIVTVHPDNIPGEVKGKGGNITYAARQIKRVIIDKEKIPYENVIVTTLDSDHRVDPQYFACLSYTYLTTPDPVHKSFQPLPMFFNNIWHTAFPMRIIAMGSTFWQLIEATRPYRLRNFASHAQSLEALVKTDFWSTKSIVEDGHQYWRSYFTFDGNYDVVPLFVPIYQDAVLAGNFLVTAKEQYLQKRRWAWGVSDIPFAITNALKNHRKLPFLKTWQQIFRLVEGHYSWATTSIILAFIGWVPILFNPSYRSTVMAYNFPYFYSRLLSAAMIGMIITLTLSTILLPPHPGRKKFRKLYLALEWLVTPFLLAITNIIFGSMPAVESQSRLMFGRYLGYFRVTIKKPVPAEISIHHRKSA